MDSILILELDRIYRINWIFYLLGFRMKPSLGNPLYGKNDRHWQGTASIYFKSISLFLSPNLPMWLTNFRRQTDAVIPVSSGNWDKIKVIL